jgi:hypothetical protein
MITVETKYVAYFMAVSRQAVADTDTSTIIEGARDFTVLARLLLLLILIIGNIVFMNFMTLIDII